MIWAMANNLHIVNADSIDTIIVAVISSPSHFTIALHLEAQLRGECPGILLCRGCPGWPLPRLPGRPLIGHLLPAVPPPIGQLAGAESGSGQEMWSTNTRQLTGVLGILYIIILILCHLSYGLCLCPLIKSIKPVSSSSLFEFDSMTCYLHLHRHTTKLRGSWRKKSKTSWRAKLRTKCWSN